MPDGALCSSSGWGVQRMSAVHLDTGGHASRVSSGLTGGVPAGTRPPEFTLYPRMRLGHGESGKQARPAAGPCRDSFCSFGHPLDSPESHL